MGRADSLCSRTGVSRRVRARPRFADVCRVSLVRGISADGGVAVQIDPLNLPPTLEGLAWPRCARLPPMGAGLLRSVP